VAILAVFPHVGEHRLDVALHALDFFVHPAQWVFSFIVVEFRNRADGLPGGCRVAVLARNRQRAVRAAGVAPLARG
jgi:hypothetical protein